MPIIHAKDGTSISFSDQGSGQPVLFLHGWMMSKQIWHFQLPLSSTLRIITMDLRGHGRSDSTAFSYSACVDDIEALLDYLEIENIIIVGWSMGSQIAIKTATLLKERVAGLILVGSTARFCSSDDYPCGLPAKETRGMAVRLKRDYKVTASQFFKSMFSAEETASADIKDIAAKTVYALPSIHVSISALSALTATDLRYSLPHINLPVLLIHGAEDSICPVGAALFMADHLPLAISKIIPSSGHAPFLTTPEIFNAEVSGFARRINGRD